MLLKSLIAIASLARLTSAACFFLATVTYYSDNTADLQYTWYNGYTTLADETIHTLEDGWITIGNTVDPDFPEMGIWIESTTDVMKATWMGEEREYCLNEYGKYRRANKTRG